MDFFHSDSNLFYAGRYRVTIIKPAISAVFEQLKGVNVNVKTDV